MPNNIFIKADEIAQELGVSKPYAYKLVKRMNEELQKRGFVTIPGRVSKQYYREKVYGVQPKERGAN
jgi:Mn-dependent DtxR family transcriptional regulator